MIYYQKFPFTKLQGKLPCTEKPSINSYQVSHIPNPNLPSHFINTDLYYLQISTGQHSQYSDYDINWKIWGSNLVRNNRTISSPKHPDQLQRPPSLQLQLFLCSKVASVNSLTTHICLQPSLKISGAIPPLNQSLSRHIFGHLHFTLTSYLCTYLSTGHILSGLIKEHF